MAARAADVPGTADPQPSRRERNKLRTRVAILAAASKCIAATGVQGTTMEQIAAAADLSRATLFNHFGSKSDIVDALVDQIDAGFHIALASWRRMGGLSTGERLLGLFAASAYYLNRASPVERILVGVSWSRWSEAAGFARTARLIAGFRDLLEDGRNRGEVADAVDLTVAAEIVAHSYMGMIHAWRMDEGYPTAARMQAAARMIARMLSPELPLPDLPPRPPRR